MNRRKLARLLELAAQPDTPKIDLTVWSDEDLRTLVEIQHRTMRMVEALTQQDIETLESLTIKYSIK